MPVFVRCEIIRTPLGACRPGFELQKPFIHLLIKLAHASFS